MSTAADVIEVMKARASVRKYDPQAKIPQEELDEILEIATRVPSSWNLQHWRFLVIASPEMKERLRTIANNQAQVSEASVTVVVLGDLKANETARVVYGESLKKGEISWEVYDRMIGQVDEAYQNNFQFARDEAMLNAGLAAMQIMLAAKAKGYDTCPIGGFDRKKLVEAFRVPDRYIPVMLISIGKKAGSVRPTQRLSLDQVTIRESF
ncbi:nitroreductase family protein [Thermoactinomyces mirandus]|uniref:Nitroreductase family protein n=1 Tax=Thermoactinomyces mirandus TaxID=2756294 RepID=A0A7W1XU04_9BACL|nr:nitroreductase family protein [Thermoactinomyces mirandus]MBA4603062.1 nitroreductase family protein [Thermoactinomyces mirandus]